MHIVNNYAQQLLSAEKSKCQKKERRKNILLKFNGFFFLLLLTFLKIKFSLSKSLFDDLKGP